MDKFKEGIKSLALLFLLTGLAINLESTYDLSAYGQILVKAAYLMLVFLFDKLLKTKMVKQLFSMPLMSVLTFAFFLSIAIATFIESDKGTVTAKILVYHAAWFEWIIFILFINLIANIIKYKLFTKEKIGSLIFHLSFLIVVVGAFITRNFGYEGNMLIPEGQAVNYILTADTYLQMKVDDGDKQYSYDMPLMVSEHVNNSFSHAIDFPGKESVTITYNDFIPGYLAKDTVQYTENGSDFLHIVTVGENGRKNNYLKDGEMISSEGLKITFNNADYTDAVKIIELDSGYFVMSPYDLTYLQMSDQSQGTIKRDSLQRFYPMRLYTVGGVRFVFKQVFKNAELVKQVEDHSPMGTDNLIVQISQAGQSTLAHLPGGEGLFPNYNDFHFNGLHYRLCFGSKVIKLPFAIHLRDFQLETYPGTQSPSSYASEVSVIEGNETYDYRIFMNHVLDHGGYRFFQSSYRIEQGMESTILSANHDWWGTQITYFGYILMGLGMFLSLFLPGSRMRFLFKKANEIRKKREALMALVVLFFISFNHQSFAQSPFDEISDDQYIPVDKEHADKFGHLVIQNYNGRYTPVSTFAYDFIKKVSRQTSYKEMDPMQVFISLHADYGYWQNQPFIYVYGDSTRRLLGIEGRRASMNDFYDAHGNYKLAEKTQAAMSKDVKKRNMFEKDMIKTNERYSLFKGLVLGQYLKIFPIKGDESNVWRSPADNLGELHGDDSLFVGGVTKMYIYSIYHSRETGDWSEANKVVELIDTYQHKAANPDIMPSRNKVKLEVFYNKSNLFDRASYAYLAIGFILLILQFVQVFKPKFNLKWPIRIGVVLVALVAVFHALALGIRWYLSGHAPWSNGYEAIVFIAFIVVLAGLFFSRYIKIILGAAAILGWLMLFVAHLNNMDPQISNLEPVLKSYWLMIHVAIITASYGFLGLSAIVGIVTLVADIFTTTENRKQIYLVNKELRYINEVSMTIGLFMLTIGTFLGGVWANESWGRYWGWDAKETWALASVLVYTIVLHFRFIPGMKSDFVFNVSSLWAFSSIIMTFYGVNFYLSGMHSYATGEPVPIPAWVPITVVIFLVLSIVAGLNVRKIKRSIEAKK